jgi:pimeloyl-ACP methyl ester carboxylesterase
VSDTPVDGSADDGLAYDDGRRPLTAPSRRLFAMEQRALFEVGAMIASTPLLRALGRGDRHPVLVMPGFTAGDDSTAMLRYTLRGWGYWAHGWRLGSNLGPTVATLTGMKDRLDALYARHDRKVSIVGWSLGGLYARRLARLAPDKVRQVITLGSPLQIGPNDRSSASPIGDRLQHRFDPNFKFVPDHRQGPLPVPSTSVYSRTDGVVRWQACLDVTDELHDNVEVRGSHSGLGFNPAALYVIADRLAQPEDRWRPFKAPLPLRAAFPKTASFEPDRPQRSGGRRRPPVRS